MTPAARRSLPARRCGSWTATAAGEWVRTDGVLTIDPAVAGAVDVDADSDYRTGFASVGTQRDRWRASVRMSGYSEDRGNGTPRAGEHDRLASAVR